LNFLNNILAVLLGPCALGFASDRYHFSFIIR